MDFQDCAPYPQNSLCDNMAWGLRLGGTPAYEIDQRVVSAARLLRLEHMRTEIKRLHQRLGATIIRSGS